MPGDPRTTPTGIRAPHGARVMEITWADGRTSQIPHSLLRGYCPCAGCQGHSGTISFVEGGNQEIRDVRPVGNYAVAIEWGDLHASGIYSFRYLRELSDFVEERGADAVPPPELPRK